MKISTKIEKLRRKLHLAIEHYGIDSPVVAEISKEMDALISKYYYELEKKYRYEDEVMLIEYKNAIEKIKQLTREFSSFPTVAEWNQFAKKNGYMSSASIEYISGLNWHKLRDKLGV